MRPLRAEDAFHRRDDHFFLIETRNEDADEWSCVRLQRGRLASARMQAVPQRQDRQKRQAQRAQHDGDQKQALHGQVQIAEEAEAQSIDPQLHGRARRHRHGVGAAHARQLIERHQSVAVGPQRIDQPGQGRHRAAAITAGVMQQHHLTGLFAGDLEPFEGLLDDRPRRRLLPVIGIDAQTGDQIAETLSHLERLHFVGGRWFGVAKIGRTKKTHRPPRQDLKQALSGVDLQIGLDERRGADVGMGPGVIADEIALAHLSGHQGRFGLHVLADDEKGCCRFLGFQHIENFRGPTTVGAVIEG